MKRVGLILILMGVLALPALSAEVEPRPQQQPQRPNVQAQQQNQIQQLVADIYVGDFRQALDLNEDQFLKVNMLIRRFITMKFSMAARSLAIAQQLDRLSSLPNPSEEEVQALVMEKTTVDKNMGNMESMLLAKIR